MLKQWKLKVGLSDGSTQEAGTISIYEMSPKGEWASGTSYAKSDVVSYNGGSYVARNAVSGSTTNPAEDTTNWQNIAEKGDTGTRGAQGVQGEPGEQGAPGVSVSTVTLEEVVQ